jgi:hypothetical protein
MFIEQLSKLKSRKQNLKWKEKKAELLIILFFCLFNLRVLNWFEYPNILISGDSRPPLNREAFLKRAFNTWDETDFGLLSVYQPRILDPYYLLITIIQTLGASLYLAQMITIFLMYSLSSILMYIYVKQITEGDKIAAFVAAIFLTSNIYLITDRDATAIPFIDTIMMILPSIVCFIKCIKEESYVLATVAGLLFILTYGTFPNYRTTLFGFLILTLTLIYIYGKNGIKVQYRKNETSSVSFSLDTKLLCTHLKYLIVFCIAFLSASIWIFVSVSAGIKHFLTTLQNVSMPLWVIKSLKLYDVFRLIAKWGFYSGALGKPYVPYAESYFNNSLLVLSSYIPPILAFAAVLLPHSKKLTTYFSGIALLSLILISAPLPELYSSLTYYLPFMIVLRESAQWAILLIISYGVLLGKTVSFIHRNLSNSLLQVTTLCLILVLLIFTAYPLTTGDVSKNWLNPDYKGSYLPNSYVEINNVVSSEYWSLLIPLREIYVSYNLSKIPLNAGNPYPLIFSKPIISGLGTEYVQSQNLDLIKKIHEIMLNKRYINIAPYGTASASSNQNETLSSNLAMDRDYNTRWASAPSMPQWIEIAWNSTQELSKIRIIFESAFANDYVIETWNGTCWEKQIEVRNNTSLQPEYFFQQPIPTTKLRITFTKASAFNMVSIWELEAYAQTEGVSKFLGILGIKHLILEKCLILGKAYDVSELHINQSKNFILIKEWNEIDLYDNTHALQKLYTATNILKYNTLDEMYNIIDETEWEKLQNSALINSTKIKNSEIYGLVSPENFTWEELSPTSYEAHVNSRGPFFLVLLQTYDEHWQVHVNGKPVPEEKHYKVNAFANGWLINETGNLTITIQYETQNLILISAIPSIIIPFSLIVFFGRKNLKKIGNILHSNLKIIDLS